MKTLLAIFLVILSLLPASISFAEDAEFQEWLSDFQQEAISAGVSLRVVSQALTDVQYNDRVIKLDRNQPEFHLTLHDYLERTVSRKRVLTARQLYRQHKDLLLGIERRYGVQSRFLLALWGIETDFGRITGDFPVIEALATLSYDPRRSSFFKKELLAALRVVDAGYVPLERMAGSWAGALGYMQFLPSVYLRYGVDYNRDGHIEIWQGGGDLFASASNYLAESGWQSQWTWGREVKLLKEVPKELLGLSQKKMLPEWQSLGVRRLGGGRLPQVTLEASLIQPDKEPGRYFLVYDNFRVLLKWNRSTYYAVAVGLLSDMIKE